MAGQLQNCANVSLQAHPLQSQRQSPELVLQSTRWPFTASRAGSGTAANFSVAPGIVSSMLQGSRPTRAAPLRRALPSSGACRPLC